MPFLPLFVILSFDLNRSWLVRTKVIDDLLAHPDINVNLQDNNGTSPLFMAATSNDFEVLKKLTSRPEICYDVFPDDLEAFFV